MKTRTILILILIALIVADIFIGIKMQNDTRKHITQNNLDLLELIEEEYYVEVE